MFNMQYPILIAISWILSTAEMATSSAQNLDADPYASDILDPMLFAGMSAVKHDHKRSQVVEKYTDWIL